MNKGLALRNKAGYDYHVEITKENSIKKVTTHVVRLKLFRLKAEGTRRTRLLYFSGNIWLLHQTFL